ncbi:hypothetical protein AB4422_12755 [Vibrio splendidus]
MYLLDTQFFQYMKDNTARHELFSDVVENYLSRPRIGQLAHVKALSEHIKSELRDLASYQNNQERANPFSSHQMTHF